MATRTAARKSGAKRTIGKATRKPAQRRSKTKASSSSKGQQCKPTVVDLKNALTSRQLQSFVNSKSTAKIRLFERSEGQELDRDQLRALLDQADGEDCPIVTLNAPFKLSPLDLTR